MDPVESKIKYTNNKYRIITLGLLIHILLLLAVFDVYFSSPLDQGMVPIKSTDNPPAKRLVLIVADGLRAEAVYGKNEEVQIPFLSEMKKTGSWGIAHTRVPTESRPGHVAILAGIYEDPSAILKGWKANPVYFDSVISESDNAWCWGSPDIINLFNADNSHRVHLYTYSPEMEDFGKNNTGLLDTWVYNKVERFIKEKVQTCRTCEKYFGGGNLFFLHLLGIDTAGHGYKPHSQEYMGNIRLVDEITRNITELFKTTFKDNSTVFVFTADHGMTDWGSHGSGSKHETEVPIIAWGAGIKVNEKRQDISQIDIAPLLSSLIGINIPVNSLGILPINYLDINESDLSNLLLSNTLQLLKIFDVKRLRTERSAFVFIPFKDLTAQSIGVKLKGLNLLGSAGHFKELMKECVEFMQLLIEGINYYHNYYQYPVLISISLGFLEWIMFLSVSAFLSSNSNSPSRIFSKLEFISSLVIVLLLCYKQKFPLTYYLYFSFPVVMFFILLGQLKVRSVIGNITNVTWRQVFFKVVFYLIGIELLIYGFFDRLAFTVLMVLVGVWVFFSRSFNRNTSSKEKCVWTLCCFILAVFPSLPVMKTEFNIPLYVCGTLGWILLFREMYLNKIRLYYSEDIGTAQYKPFYIQFLCLILSALYVLLLEKGIISSDSSIKYISWLILVLPILMIPFTNTFIVSRLIATFFAFAPFYLLVSPNYEVLFSAFYVALLCAWLLIESKSFQFGKIPNIVYYVKFENYKSNTKNSSDVFRRAFFFMVFIFLGFFGTGNIASLNSFDPMWVRAFLTVFSPFKMTGLILLKLMVPFIFTCCVFRAINSVGKENVLNTFCVILIFSDLMVLQFLYLIKNIGSWLDIGTSLSHFIIMEAFVTILLLLYGLAHVLTTVRY